MALPDFSSCLRANSFFSHCSDIVTNMLWKKYIIDISSGSKGVQSLIELLASFTDSRNQEFCKMSFAKLPKMKERTTEIRSQYHLAIIKMTFSFMKCVISSTYLIHNFHTILKWDNIYKLLWFYTFNTLFYKNYIFLATLNFYISRERKLSLKRTKSLERRNESCKDSLQRCQKI